MDVLGEAALKHPWGRVRDEAVLTMQRITGQRWVQEGGCITSEVEDQVKQWWQSNGRAFVKQRRMGK